MTDETMDTLDVRLATLLADYGDVAVTTFDPEAIAHKALTRQGGRRRPVQLRSRSGLAVLLAAGLAVLGGVAIVAGTRPADGEWSTPIIITADGPEHVAYEVPLVRGRYVVVRFENRSLIGWVLAGPLTEKFPWCRVVSGPAADPCTVAPGATVEVRPTPWFLPGDVEIYLARAGAGRDFLRIGIPVTLHLRLGS